MHEPERTRITAAICTYNRYDLLEKAIASLIAQNLDAAQYKTIIVDNSPANATAIEFQERYHGKHNIHYLIEKTPGLSNARNVAARMCDSEYIAYIDDDAIADVTWLKSILAAFDRFGSQAGIVCGKVKPIWPTDPPNWLPRSLFSALTIVDWGDPMRIAEPGQTFAGTNFSIRVASLLELGGFTLSLGRVGSSAILLSNEEAHLIDRMRAAGYETIWAPDAKVDHLVHADRISQGWLRKRYAWQAVSDFMVDPVATMKDLERRWQSISDYLQYWPPHKRTPRVLFESVGDPKLFEKQMVASYDVTLLLLAGENIQIGVAQSKDRLHLPLWSYLHRLRPRELYRSLVRLLKQTR